MQVSLPSARSSAERPSRQAGKRGFALLITITLLAFLVLLLVSLASLTRVETQVASNTQQLAQARQNALMALNIALGQLQKFAGPDQRVTATADIAGGTGGVRLANNTTPAKTSSINNILNGLGKVQPGTRYWTGVWGNADPSKPSSGNGNIYERSPSPRLLNWLVSGNEKAAFTPSTAANTFGQITSSNTNTGNGVISFLPQGSSVLPTSATQTGTIKNRDNAIKDVVLLVGPASAGDTTTNRTLPDTNTENYSDRYVVAPLVDIKAAAGSVLGLAPTATPVIGRYAYWVGDEGVKAKYNLVDSYANYTLPTGNTDVDFTTREGNILSTTSGALARYRLMAAQRNGLEGLADLNYQANDAKVDRVLNLGQMRFAGSTTVNAPAQQQRIHDITTTSMGVLTNTLDGGLRKDLTAYLTTGDLGAANKIIPTDYSPTQGPTWGLLKSYTDLATAAEVTIRPASTTQMGIFPIVSDVRLLFGLKPETDNPTDYSTTGAQALFNPLIVLTNPYNRPLRVTGGSAGDLDMEFKATAFNGSKPFTEPFQGQLYIKGLTDSKGAINYSILSRLNPDGTQMQSPSLLNNVKFRFPAGIVIQPGQSQIFSITANQMDNSGNNTATLEVGVPSAFNYYGKPIPGAYLGSGSYQIEDYGNSTPIDIVFSNSSGIVKQLKAIDLDYPNIGGAALKGQAFAVGMFKANVNYPGDSTPATNTLNYNRTLRVFADFNLRAAHNRRLLYLVAAPPYYGRWLPVGGTAENEVPSDFTNHLSSEAYWGRSTIATGGLHEARLFDLPTPPASSTEIPFLSLAQLQHTDLTADDDDVGVGHQPGYAVGNSFCPPYLSRDQTKQPLKDWYSIQKSSEYGEESHNYYDISYRLNCALWDKYFVSAIPQTATSYESVNPRYRFVPDSALATASATTKATTLHDPTLTARYLMVDGAFNINSTSIEAWKAVLGGSRGLNMPGDTQTHAAFPRSVNQPGVASDPDKPDDCQASGDGADTYTGFRRLNDTQLTNLATEIVKQVRLRGPFVSLAQFVNRTPTNTSASLALQGPLQTAIDSAAGGINTFTSTDATPDKDKVAIQNASDQGEEDGGSKAVVGTFGIFPSSTPPPANEQGYRSTAAPGWLTQADLLQVIGPALSARSDTFVIRTYGDVKNPLDTSAPPISQAWCEAIVQRMPDYVNTSDNAEVDPASLTQLDNKNFGRRFKVVSFRWLTSNDI